MGLPYLRVGVIVQDQNRVIAVFAAVTVIPVASGIMFKHEGSVYRFLMKCDPQKLRYYSVNTALSKIRILINRRLQKP